MFEEGLVSLSFEPVDPAETKVIRLMSNSDELGDSFFYPSDLYTTTTMYDFFRDQGSCFIGRYDRSISAWWPFLRQSLGWPPADSVSGIWPLLTHPDTAVVAAIAAAHERQTWCYCVAAIIVACASAAASYMYM
jgi:hypothetical protein